MSDDPSREVLDSTNMSLAIGTAATDVEVETASHNKCYENSCKSKGGCAGCVEIIVLLPLGATVKAIRYYSTAGGPPGDVPLRQITPGDFAWSLMEPAQQSQTPINVVVKTVYFNRSHNRIRKARMEVDWT